MYVSRMNDDEGIGVALMVDMTDAEWQSHFEDIRRVATWSPKLGRRGVFMMHVPGKFARPNPAIREELARCTSLEGYDPYVAFVTEHIVIRSMLTVLKWMNKRTRYEMGLHADVEAGTKWLEGVTGRPMSLVREYHAEISRAATPA